jgi:hypothetical protein
MVSAREREFAANPRWEYMVVSPEPSARSGEERWSQDALPWPELNGKTRMQALDWLGEEGWELVAVDRDHFYLKRRRLFTTPMSHATTPEDRRPRPRE